MFKVFTCLQQHDLRLVIAAGVVCLLATGSSVWLLRRAQTQGGGLSLGWLGFTALAAGAAIWATHFIAMLAYAPDVPTGYQLPGTAISLLAAIAAAGAGFALAVTLKGWRASVYGGVVLGGGVSLMHYLGMGAFHVQGRLIWDPAYVAASVAIGVGLSIAALLTAGPGRSTWRDVCAALLLTGAICGMHFTGMAAVTILPDPSLALPAFLAPRPVLAMIAAAVALPILVSAGIIAAGAAASHRTAFSRLRTATNAMPAALAFFDSRDRLVVWNAIYERMVPRFGQVLRPGLPYEDILRAVHDDDDWIAERKRERRELRSSEHKVPGQDRWIRVDNVATEDGGLITVGVDVTELKRDAARLEQALGEAKAADRAKSAFLANMSHEIRTPLNGVGGVADALSRTPLNEQQQAMVSLIRNSAQAVDALLANLLELTAGDSDEPAAVQAHFNLAKVIRAASEPHRQGAVAKGLAFELKPAPEVDAEVVGDAPRLTQIVGNLVDNAVKFTERGGVTVAAWGLNDGRFRIEVRDTGRGFGAAEKERLFEPFHQSDDSDTRRHGGAGLGLTLARRHAALLGAGLTCASVPGQGSVFTLDIALTRRAGEAAAPFAPASAPSGSPVKLAPEAGEPDFRALIVDDNPTNRLVLEMMLQQLGAAWVSVENGREALDAFAAARFDAVLMDIQMPVMDGLAATREIRAREAAQGLPRTPVIIVSASCLPEHLAAGRAAGADEHLAKPVSAAALIAALQAAAEVRAGRAA